MGAFILGPFKSPMEKRTSTALRIELAWLLFTLLCFGVIAAPIFLKAPSFPFYWTNLLFVAVFITASRYIFFLPGTFLARRQLLKISFIFLSIPFIFFLVSQIHNFQTFLDEQGQQSLVGDLPLPEETQMSGYIQAEMLLFGVGSVIAMGLFAFRMLLSVWRVHNHKAV